MKLLTGIRLLAAACLVILALAYVDAKSHIFRNLEWVPEGKSTWKPFDFESTLTSANSGIFYFRAEMAVTGADQGAVLFNVDDCLKSITINSTPVALEQVFYKTPVCPHGGYLEANFSPFLKPGINTLKFEVENTGGLVGITALPHDARAMGLIVLLLLGLACVLALGPLLKLLGFGGLDRTIFYASAFTLLAYTLTTPWNFRAHDVQGHLEYMLLLIRTGIPPLSRVCWECSQQPTYYWALAALRSVAGRFVTETSTMLLIFQLAQVTFGLAFLVVARLVMTAIRAPFPSLGYLLVASSVSGVLHFARIGNDAPGYFLIALTILFIIREWSEGRLRDLLYAGLFCVIAILCKLTALFLLPAIFVLQFGALFRRRFTLRTRLLRAALSIGILFCGVAAFFMKPLLSRDINPAINIPGELLKVPTNLAAFFSASPYYYFHTLAADPWHDESGRRFFWNYVVKSALHGEFEITNALNREVATVQDLLAAAILVLLAYAIIRYRLWHLRSPTFALLTTTFFGFVMLISYRISFPYACNQDFRFIYPAILSLGLLGYMQIRWTSLLILAFAIINFSFIWIFVLSTVY